MPSKIFDRTEQYYLGQDVIQVPILKSEMNKSFFLKI